MFDVFYFGEKPGVFPHERRIDDIDDAYALSRTRMFWVITADADYSEFDFSWEPAPWESHQRHTWRSQWQKTSGTYLYPKGGYQDTHYRTDQRVLKRSALANWDIPPDLDTSSFDFSWHPNYAEPPYIYQFGTQWQKTGGPRYVVPGATQVKYVLQVKATSKVTSKVPVVFIDHFNRSLDAAKQTVSSKVAITKSTRFIDNYLNTLRRIAASMPAETEHAWIVSSVCDYTDFDFSWHPSDWQGYMLHVFASDNQKFGDTFYMHVPTFRTGIESVELLDWYDLNFVEGISVPRLPVPVVQHSEDTNSVAVTKSVVTDPLTIFTTSGHLPDKIPAVPLWRDKTRAVTPLTKTGSTVIVPRDAIGNINSQLWDYPYVDTKLAAIPEAPLDIVFISNGEPHADKNWEHLNSSLQGKPNRVVRVDGVNGRVAAYQAAAAMSSTPWFLAVFAKLRVNPDFDWAWTPDYLQAPKHYIFHAKNPVNGLEYGHQAMIAYNKRMCFENTGAGLDFTMDQLHEVIPELSGVAEYNVDPWTTWRTAFREVLKLRQIAETSPDYAVKHRLAKWQEPADSSIPFGEWSHKGAVDAIQYYNSVNGEFAKLKLSYEWEWLSKFYTARYHA